MIDFIIGALFMAALIKFDIIDKISNKIKCKLSKCSKTSEITIKDGYVVFVYPNGNEYNVVKAGEHYGHLSNLCECELKQKLGK